MKQSYLLVAILMLLMGCEDSSPTLRSNITKKQKTLAANAIGLSFPANTKFLLFQHSQGIDDRILIKMSLANADLKQFLNQKPFAGTQWSSTNNSVYDDPNMPRWNPSAATKFRSYQFSLPSSEALNVLIDDSNGASTVVYLEWFEM